MPEDCDVCRQECEAQGYTPPRCMADCMNAGCTSNVTNVPKWCYATCREIGGTVDSCERFCGCDAACHGGSGTTTPPPTTPPPVDPPNHTCPAGTVWNGITCTTPSGPPGTHDCAPGYHWVPFVSSPNLGSCVSDTAGGSGTPGGGGGGGGSSAGGSPTDPLSSIQTFLANVPTMAQHAGVYLLFGTLGILLILVGLYLLLSRQEWFIKARDTAVKAAVPAARVVEAVT